LGKIATNAENVVPALLTLFHKEQNTEVRYAIVEALGHFGAEARDAMSALIDLLHDNDTNMRGSAVFALGRIATNAESAVPALLALLYKEQDTEVRYAIVEALSHFEAKAKDAVPALVSMFQRGDADLRSVVAEALYKIGPDAKELIPIWFIALNDENSQTHHFALNALIAVGPSIVPELTKIVIDGNAKSRNDAALILKEFGPAAKEAVPALIATLVDDNHKLNSPVALVLGKIGPDAKDAVPVLITALKAKSVVDRSSAAVALGGIRSGAKEAVPILIEALNDPESLVRQMAAQSIGQIAIGIFDTKSTEMLPQMKKAYELMRNHSDQKVKNNAAWVKRTVDYFESIWWIKAREQAANTIKEHPSITFAITAYLALQFTWLLLFWLRPLSLLRVTMSLSKTGEKAKIPIIDVPIPLKTALVFPPLHYHPRLLDAWVSHYLVIARDNFATKRTVAERLVYVPMPVVVNETMCGNLSASALQPIFDKRKVTLLIAGEGGAGKTSLACQMATWAMADDITQRLCKTHRLLPVLVESNLDPRNDNKDVLLESIRGGLREMIGETEPIFEELFLQLLRKRRVLVIVDSLSELNELTRKCMRPAQADFPIAMLIVTSRIDEGLGGASKTMLRPLRLKRDRLSTFMDRYLEQLGKRDLFNDEEYFDACRRLSQLVGDREITVLIAKMYAEAMIAAKESDVNAQGLTRELPRNLPDLMLGYVKQLNNQVQADEQDLGKVVRVAKVVAWECLKQTCSPTMPKRSDVLLGLSNETDAETLLKYLEERLQLIQTAGPVSDLIRFSLDPLAEYLAALYLIERCGNRDDLWKDFFERAQEQPNAPEAIKGFLLAVRDCCEEKGNEYLVPNWIDGELARLSDVDPAADNLKRLKQRINRWVANLKLLDAEDRAAAAEMLGRIGPAAKEVIHLLIDALEDPSVIVRRSAASSLGRIGIDSEEAILALISALKASDASVRQSAALALGQIGLGANAAVPALIAAIEDNDVDVRRYATETLVKIGLCAVPALTTALSSQDKLAFSFAAFALGKIGPGAKAAVPTLVTALQDQDASVRRIAVEALVDIRPTSMGAISALINALKDEDVMVRFMAGSAFSVMGPEAEESTPMLIAALEDEDYMVRCHIATAIGRIGPKAKDAVPVLIKALTDQNELVRSSAAIALYGIGPEAKSAVPMLIEALHHQDESTRTAAAKALHRIDPQTAQYLSEKEP